MDEELLELERLLKEQLRPRSPSPGFSERVMARLPSRRWQFNLRAAAAAIVLLSILSGVYWKREHDERVLGERAHQQLLVALRITAATLNDVQHKLQVNGGDRL